MLDVTVRKAAHTHYFAILLALGVSAAVALLVPVLLRQAPPKGYDDLVPYLWVATVAFPACGVFVLRRSRKTLRIGGNSEGDHVIYVDSEPVLELPVRYCCDQFTVRTKRIPMFHAHLTMWDGSGRVLDLCAVRGVAHGPLPGWPENGPDSAPDQERITRYDTSSDALTQVRAHLDDAKRTEDA